MGYESSRMSIPGRVAIAVLVSVASSAAVSPSEWLSAGKSPAPGTLSLDRPPGASVERGVGDSPRQLRVGGDQVRLGYDVYYRILRVASVRTDSTIGPYSYRTEMTIRTEGLVGTLLPWILHSESRGDVVEDGGLRPAMHRSESTSRRDVSRVEMRYRDAGAPWVEVDEPRARRDERDPVPDEFRADTVDPLTATLAVLQAVAAGRGCATTQRVFDGRLRYDVRYEDLGTVVLGPSRHSVYVGQARLCRSTLRPIAGFTEAGREDGGSLVTRSWIAAPVPGASPVPVQLETAGRRGTLVFYLRPDADPR